MKGVGGLCMMSLLVWLHGPMIWDFVPDPMFLPGVPCRGGGVSVQGGLCKETPQIRQ